MATFATRLIVTLRRFSSAASSSARAAWLDRRRQRRPGPQIVLHVVRRVDALLHEELTVAVIERQRREDAVFLIAHLGEPGLIAAREQAAGFGPEALQHYAEHFGGFGRVVAPLPESYRRLQDGDRIELGEETWEVVVGRVHSPDHACLYNESRNVLIAGDQILPTISSNVSVWPTEPAANPLLDWFESITALEDRLPPDVLVLPAHEAPFYNLHVRLSQLIEAHKRDLGKLFDYLDEPRRAVDCFPALFRREIDAATLGMATGETVAHLNCLLWRRRIRRRL